MMKKIAITALVSILCAASGSCKKTNSAPTLKDGYYDCGNDGMAQRRAGVFERTKSCAVDAIGVGMAEAIQTAALAAGELKAISGAIIAFNRAKDTAAFSINVAKGTLCVETLVGNYALTETMKSLTQQLIEQKVAPDGEYASLKSLINSIVTGGGTGVIESLRNLLRQPTIEGTIALATKSFNSFADIRQVIVACSGIFTSVLNIQQLSVVHLGKLSKAFGRIGVISAIGNCTSAGLFNAIDVGTEVNCLVQDLRYLEESNREILSKERDFCEGLADIAALPTSRPAIASPRNMIDPETGELDKSTSIRAQLCQQTISRWGRCLASNPIQFRTKSYCTKMCTVRSNSVYDDFNRVASKTGFSDVGEIAGLVSDAATFCTNDENPAYLRNDGLAGCVNLCMQGTGGRTTYDDPGYAFP